MEDSRVKEPSDKMDPQYLEVEEKRPTQSKLMVEL